MNKDVLGGAAASGSQTDQKAAAAKDKQGPPSLPLLTLKKSSTKIEEKKGAADSKEESKEVQGADNKIYQNLSKFFVPKKLTDHNLDKCAKVTQYVEVTMFELLQKVRHETEQKHRKLGDSETCPICMCDLYDDLETTPES